MSRIIATITSKFGAKGYYGLPVTRVKDYTVDSALDTDTDQWSLSIGDPRAELIALLKRDSEVRVRLVKVNDNGITEGLMTGYADVVGLTEDGTLALQGRDLSAAAVDDTAIPFHWHQARPDKIIVAHARARGFSNFKIPKITPIINFTVDGSESEWEMWYRMVRNRKMWIWTEPDGSLNINVLNYGADPDYFFGTPNTKYAPASHWIKVQAVNIQKNTSTRVGEVWVYGETGNKFGFGPIKAKDTLIKDWIKRPVKIIAQDAGHTSQAQALKDAREEVFEGIVGSLEIAITIPDPGFVIRQNRTCYLNLPSLDYSGEFFVVGTHIANGTDGATQVVRLREKKYALTRRIPADPTLKEDTGANVSASAFGSAISGSTGSKEWGGYFLIAAKAWHGGFDLSLFLATLLAICDHESSFTNVREGASGREWMPVEDFLQANPRATVRDWKEMWANSSGNPLNPYNREAGVGPMQLTSVGYKHWADERMSLFDEYEGGRWHPSANIWAGARALNSKLFGLTPTEANLWIGVERYNGSGPDAEAYMRAIRQAVITEWLPQVQEQLTSRDNILPSDSTKTQQPYAANVPAVVRKIINFAERQERKPYQLGASGPDSYDCSGLVYAAYAAAGLSTRIGGRLSTWGYWEFGNGKADLEQVTVDALLPGDMVFFAVPSDGGVPPQHMGIYYHDNLMIAAPRPGKVVYVESIAAPGVWTCLGGMRVKGIWPVNPATSSTEPGFSTHPLP